MTKDISWDVSWVRRPLKIRFSLSVPYSWPYVTIRLILMNNHKFSETFYAEVGELRILYSYINIFFLRTVYDINSNNFQTDLFNPVMEFLQVLTLWVRVDLGVMEMKTYPLLPRSPELEPHHLIQFRVMHKISIHFFWGLTTMQGVQSRFSKPGRRTVFKHFLHSSSDFPVLQSFYQLISPSFKTENVILKQRSHYRWKMDPFTRIQNEENRS